MRLRKKIMVAVVGSRGKGGKIKKNLAKEVTFILIVLKDREKPASHDLSRGTTFHADGISTRLIHIP